jgi:hypothetical protein
MAPNESVLVATTIGAVLSGTFIGSSLTLSTMVIPALTVSCSNAPKELVPTILSNATRSWQYIYDVGKKFGPMAGVIGSAAYAYAAYSLPASSTTERRMLYTAAVVNSLLGPFTVAFMTRTNSELIRRSTAARTGKGESNQLKGAKEGSIEAYDTPRLLQRWSKLNAARSIFPFAAAALTATALVSLY